MRNHGYLRAAVCVPPVHLANPEANARAHLDILRRAYNEGAQYAVCPELGLTGYSCGDLFFQAALQQQALAALATVASETASWNMMFSVGLPLLIEGGLYNCAVTLYGGHAVMTVPKSYPPNYREFYELRWFQPGSGARTEEIDLLGERVPFGTGLLARVEGVDGFVLHTDICEDIWVPVPPSTIAALSGATVLANLSASNITVGKAGYREELVASSSAKTLSAQLYSAVGFGESTADLAWDGQGIIADRGDVVARTERFSLTGSHAVVDLDLEALASDRSRQTSWNQNAAEFARPVREIVLDPVPEQRDAAVFRTLRKQISPLPYAPEDPARLDARCEEVFLILATSLARRLQALPEGSRHMVLGVSGGRDSTLALLVAVRALDMLGSPRSDLLGVTMPGFGTTSRTKNVAYKLMTAVGARSMEVDIRPISGDVMSAIGHDLHDEDVTFENVQAWTRKFVLFSLASEHKGIDLGTGDLSELALGWTTYGGDHMSHYAVNAGVPKTLVSQLIRWGAETYFKDNSAVSTALEEVLRIPISPELRRPSESGEIVQLTEAEIGSYELNDFFLYYFTRFGFRPRRIARMALHAFDGKYELTEIRSWLLVFLRRFFANQFKRDCQPDSPKVGSGGSLSPRGDWRMPSDADVSAWLADAESIPATPSRP